MKRVMVKEIVLGAIGCVIGLALYIDSANAAPHHNNTNTNANSSSSSSGAVAGSSSGVTTGDTGINTIVGSGNNTVARPIDRMPTWDEAYSGGVRERAQARAQAFKEKFCTENPDRCSF